MVVRGDVDGDDAEMTEGLILGGRSSGAAEGSRIRGSLGMTVMSWKR